MSPSSPRPPRPDSQLPLVPVTFLLALLFLLDDQLCLLQEDILLPLLSVQPEELWDGGGTKAGIRARSSERPGATRPQRSTGCALLPLTWGNVQSGPAVRSCAKTQPSPGPQPTCLLTSWIWPRTAGFGSRRGSSRSSLFSFFSSRFPALRAAWVLWRSLW